MKMYKNIVTNHSGVFQRKQKIKADRTRSVLNADTGGMATESNVN